MHPVYVSIDMKLNQEGTMDREWGINDFWQSTGRWCQEVELLMVPRPSSELPRRPSATDGSGKPWEPWACKRIRPEP